MGIGVAVGVGVRVAVAVAVAVGVGVLVGVGIGVSVGVGVAMLVNVATHVLLAFIVTTVSVQSESPLNPTKAEPELAAPVSCTESPLWYTSLQSSPQLMPGGLLVTVPLPAPVLLTNNVYVTIVVVNVARQLLSLFIVNRPSVQPGSPVQPVKVEPLSAAALSVTSVFTG